MAYRFMYETYPYTDDNGSHYTVMAKMANNQVDVYILKLKRQPDLEGSGMEYFPKDEVVCIVGKWSFPLPELPPMPDRVDVCEDGSRVLTMHPYPEEIAAQEALIAETWRSIDARIEQLRVKYIMGVGFQPAKEWEGGFNIELPENGLWAVYLTDKR